MGSLSVNRASLPPSGCFRTTTLSTGRSLRARLSFAEATGPQSGTISRGDQHIAYAGMEPLVAESPPGEVTVTAPDGGGNSFTVDNDGAGNTRVSCDTGCAESVVFANPTTSLTIQLGAGGQSIVVNAPATGFDVPLSVKGGKSPQVLKRPGAIKLRCDAGHSWMNAYVHVFDHPYYAVTDGKGRFTIKDVPAGKYTLEFWHEPIADQQPPLIRTATVEVTDGKSAPADATISF